MLDISAHEIIKHAYSKANEISAQVINSFNNSKELIYIYDEVVIGVGICKVLIDKSKSRAGVKNGR